MAHELEFDFNGQAKMFYVGEVPWHGLGKKLDRPPTIREAIRCADLDWEVERKQLVMKDSGIEVPAFATVRKTDGRILGVVGPSYEPIQNTTAFDFFEPMVASGDVSLETAGVLKEGRHVWVLGRIQRDPVEIVPGDEIIPFILFSNSHDGSRMARAGFTNVRAVCANTVQAAHSSKLSKLLKVRHTKGATLALENIREIMDLSTREFETTVENMRKLARQGVTVDTVKEYVRKVFQPKVLINDEMDEEQEEKCERLVDNIIPLFKKGRGNDRAGVADTMWGAYNAVTEYLTWERGRNADNRMTNLWLGGDKALDRAFQVAIKMCA